MPGFLADGMTFAVLLISGKVNTVGDMMEMYALRCAGENHTLYWVNSEAYYAFS